MDNITNWLWVLSAMTLSIISGSWTVMNFQSVWLILTRDARVTSRIFFLTILPGTLLRIISQFLLAKLLRVRTGRASIFPRVLPDGHLQLSYIEAEKSDHIRDGFIGASPLIIGSLAIIFLTNKFFSTNTLINGGDQYALLAFARTLIDRVDLLKVTLWIYFVFAINHSMLPSSSDRHTWTLILILLAFLGGVIFYGNFGSPLVFKLTKLLDAAIGILAFAFTLTSGLNIILGLPIWLARKILVKLTGLDTIIN